MDYQSYVAASEKRYSFRLKSVAVLDDAAMDVIESAIAKFQPIEISRPVKTILQKNPLDFIAVKNAEVHMVDLTFSLPVTAHELLDTVCSALEISHDHVVVRTFNDPVEIESRRLNAVAEIEAEAKKLGLKPAALIDDALYPESEAVDGAQYYGNAYNASLLAYLGTIEDEREERRVDPPSPLFSYLDLPDRKSQQPVVSDEDFNAGLKVGPGKGLTVGHTLLGDVDDSRLSVRRLYTDAKGKRVVLTRKLGG